MWIRSQDKEALTNGNIIYRIKQSDANYYEIILEHISDTNCIGLAGYYSYDKAIKVMNMLEKHINNGKRYFELSVAVFHFPEEEDVTL